MLQPILTIKKLDHHQRRFVITTTITITVIITNTIIYNYRWSIMMDIGGCGGRNDWCCEIVGGWRLQGWLDMGHLQQLQGWGVRF